MSNPVTVQDLVDRSLRTLSPDEIRVGSALLEDAWNYLVARKPSLDGATSGVAVQVVCAMVLRVLNNPQGLLQETIDDYTYRRDAATSAGVLYATDAELALLSGQAGQGGAFTIRPAGDEKVSWYRAGSAWLSDDGIWGD